MRGGGGDDEERHQNGTDEDRERVQVLSNVNLEVRHHPPIQFLFWIRVRVQLIGHARNNM
eukprot:COSAG05_NODE_1829_length_4002_cov_3.573917_5_plen_60_part_00